PASRRRLGSVGRSTPCVGRRTMRRCTPQSAAGKTPTALRFLRPDERRIGLVGGTTRTRWPPDGASMHTVIGGRKNADRPTVRAHRRVDTVVPLTEQAPARGRRAHRVVAPRRRVAAAGGTPR